LQHTSKPDEPKIDDTEELDDKPNEINSNFSAYLSEGDSGIVRREPFYCKELGFAMEKLKDGYSLKDLWDVIPSNK
jgi:Bardet-Biedl syndrome 5 protein